jgi:hypothetical protein
MDFVCDTPDGKTWFRIVTEAEAITESQEMGHAVEKHFRQQREAAAQSFKPVSRFSSNKRSCLRPISSEKCRCSLASATLMVPR